MCLAHGLASPGVVLLAARHSAPEVDQAAQLLGARTLVLKTRTVPGPAGVHSFLHDSVSLLVP
jgi:hypothetical protein